MFPEPEDPDEPEPDDPDEEPPVADADPPVATADPLEDPPLTGLSPPVAEALPLLVALADEVEVVMLEQERSKLGVVLNLGPTIPKLGLGVVESSS